MDDSACMKDSIWDDSVLIKAYDCSVKAANEELAKRIASCTNKKMKQTRRSGIDNNSGLLNCKMGDFVRATYVDGIDYEAKIINIDIQNGSCILKYIGYNNEQHVQLTDLISSWGKKARRAQYAMATKSKIHVNYDTAKLQPNYMPHEFLSDFVPTPPMPPMAKCTGNSAHLTAMLMSWYMSGYYTGIYEGINKAYICKTKTNQ